MYITVIILAVARPAIRRMASLGAEPVTVPVFAGMLTHSAPGKNGFDLSILRIAVARRLLPGMEVYS